MRRFEGEETRFSTISSRFNWHAIYNGGGGKNAKIIGSSAIEKRGRNYRDRQLSLCIRISILARDSSQSRRSLSAGKKTPRPCNLQHEFNARALLRCYFRGGRLEENRPRRRGTNREEGNCEGRNSIDRDASLTSAVSPSEAEDSWKRGEGELSRILLSRKRKRGGGEDIPFRVSRIATRRGRIERK